MKPREGTWPGHMDSRRPNLLPSAMIFEQIHHPTQHLRRWAGRGGKPPIMYSSHSFSIFIQTFAAFLRLLDSPLFNSQLSSMPMQIQPLNSRCSQEATSPSFRTQVGRRCPITCCFDFLPGLHFTHSPYCSHWSTTSLEFLASLPPRFSSVHPFDLCHTMPRLRHRLRFRRGSSRAPSARHRRSPYATSTSSSSEDSLE